MLKNEITVLQHIGIPTCKLEETIEFYERIGFEIVHKNKAENNQVVFLRLGQVVIETYESQDTEGKPGAINHIAFDVRDIDRAYSLAKEEGFSILDGEIRFLPFWQQGVKFFNIMGPNGEIIEFRQVL